VLLHGPSGTGKIELARVLAAAVGAALHDVRVEGLDQKVLGAYERLSAYQLCQRLASHSRPALVLFDEVEDVFRTPVHELFDDQAGAGQDKGYMTRLLEENPVPALWVCNRIDAMDPAILRRFDFILEVPTPPERVRHSILARYLGTLEVQPEWLARTSSDESLTPAHAERAVRAARLIQPTSVDEATLVLDRVLRSSLAVTRTTPAPSRRQMALGYDLALLRTDPPLLPLVASLEQRPSATLCLYGPPGTGKTAFATHLAKRLQRPLLLRRASELLGPYVGQTEANLASAFQRATQDGAVLFLDEVDSFLQRRETADRQWEVTQVNELLTQMDTFDGVFICATNRIDHLDPSSLRRFDIRVRFLFLEREQRHTLFARALAELSGAPELPPSPSARAALDRFASLTPGDFAVVVRRGKILGSLGSEEALVAALETEAHSKNDGMKSPLGFNSP
jgi:SpoVK/Ycf46/Vps4 family AAA+-type ATPase